MEKFKRIKYTDRDLSTAVEVTKKYAKVTNPNVISTEVEKSLSD